MRELLIGMGYDRWIVQALLVLPIIGAALVLAMPTRAKVVAFYAALVEFVVSLGLWWTFDPALASIQFEIAVPWIPAYGISYRVGIDGISLFMVLLTTLTMPLAIVGAFRYIAEKQRAFYALMLLLQAGMSIAVVPPNSAGDRISSLQQVSPGMESLIMKSRPSTDPRPPSVTVQEMVQLPADTPPMSMQAGRVAL